MDFETDVFLSYAHIDNKRPMDRPERPPRQRRRQGFGQADPVGQQPRCYRPNMLRAGARDDAERVRVTLRALLDSNRITAQGQVPLFTGQDRKMVEGHMEALQRELDNPPAQGK